VEERGGANEERGVATDDMGGAKEEKRGTREVPSEMCQFLPKPDSKTKGLIPNISKRLQSNFATTYHDKYNFYKDGDGKW
jgi:hypothetical protein